MRQDGRRKQAASAQRGAPKRAAGRKPSSARKEKILARNLKETLQQQDATSEVLEVISSSNFELQAVLDRLVDYAMKLCDADSANIWIADGGVLNLAASCGHSAEFKEFAKQNPILPGRETITGRVFLEGKTIHIADVLADPDFAGIGYQKRGNYRTHLGVPILRKGKAIGAFALTRSEVRPYSTKQVQLVTNFATQAAIAIENSNLVGEIYEFLQQQTAIADVLKVISSSTFDLQTVLDALVELAARLCQADFGVHFPIPGRLVSCRRQPWLPAGIPRVDEEPADRSRTADARRTNRFRRSTGAHSRCEHRSGISLVGIDKARKLSDDARCPVVARGYPDWRNRHHPVDRTPIHR